MPYVFTSNSTPNNLKAITAAQSNLFTTPITGLTAVSTVAGQIVVTWSGGAGNNVKYTYALSSGTIQSISGQNPTTIILTTNDAVTTTVTLTATVLGGSTSVVSSPVTTLSPLPNSYFYYPLNVDILDYASGTGVSDATWVAGASNSNYQIVSNTFFGSGSLVKTASNATDGLTLRTIILYQTSYSMSFWYYPGSSFGFVWSFNTAAQNGYRIYFYGTQSNGLGLYTNNGGGDSGSGTITGIVSGQWNHIVWTATYGGSSYIYVNNGTAVNGPPIYNQNTSLIPKLNINYQNSTYSSGVDCKLANFRVFVGSILTPTQITTLYTSHL